MDNKSIINQEELQQVKIENNKLILRFLNFFSNQFNI